MQSGAQNGASVGVHSGVLKGGMQSSQSGEQSGGSKSDGDAAQARWTTRSRPRGMESATFGRHSIWCCKLLKELLKERRSERRSERIGAVPFGNSHRTSWQQTATATGNV